MTLILERPLEGSPDASWSALPVAAPTVEEAQLQEEAAEAAVPEAVLRAREARRVEVETLDRNASLGLLVPLVLLGALLLTGFFP